MAGIRVRRALEEGTEAMGQRLTATGLAESAGPGLLFPVLCALILPAAKWAGERMR